MFRRTLRLLSLFAALGPAAVEGQQWEEDYTGEVAPAPQGDDYRVSVDMDASASVSLDTFQGALAPYGQWVVAAGYGNVWRPRVPPGWRPYYYGRWEWTSEGWLWVSDEPFGWAAYHYGRWAYDPYYGWVWVPGYQWAPAWVSWRYSGEVVGWAPLAPGVSVYVSVTPFAESSWTFVPCRSFVAVPVYRVAYAPAYTRQYFYATVPAPARPGVGAAPGHALGAPAWGGPPRVAIEQRNGGPLTPVRVVPAPAPGATRVGPGEVAVYRPELRLGAAARPGYGPRDPQASGFPRAAPASGPTFERPAHDTDPAARAADRLPPSTPAPAARGDDGRLAPRTLEGPAAPEGAGARGERAWTSAPPSKVSLPPHPEDRGQRGSGSPMRADYRGRTTAVPTAARPAAGGGRGSPASSSAERKRR